MGVALAAVGGFLVYVGIRNVPLLDGLREMASGKLPAGRSNNPLKFIGATIAGVLPGFIGALTGSYQLGAVKAHVAQVANSVGPRFGIKTIYGWAPGKYDHPKGLALDFMISDLGSNGRAIGNALAAFLVANARALNITYVIWYRQIWSLARAGEGWRPYVDGDSDHTDHVHASFEAAVQPSKGPQYA